MLINNYQPNRNSRKATPFALILAPTRELTSQVSSGKGRYKLKCG
jgi:superfamily II DNA/RNA helicase